MTPKDVRALRLRENASQAVFARYLNVTTGPVSPWERGEKRLRGASLKPLTLLEKNGLRARAVDLAGPVNVARSKRTDDASSVR